MVSRGTTQLLLAQPEPRIALADEVAGDADGLDGACSATDSTAD